MKKMLYAKDLVFKLPDDFNGNMADAYELIAKAYRAKEEAKSIENNDSTCYENCMQILGDDERQFQATHGIFEYEMTDTEIILGKRLAPDREE